MTTLTTILLIDDDKVDRTMVRRALEKSGLEHILVEAPDGATGLRRAEEQTFDCVLLDYRLPDVDAFELLTVLLSPKGGGQAVVMLTGEADQEIAVRLVRAGALDYLTKAEATPSSLARAIRYAKARRQFLTELNVARREAEEKSRALDILNRQKTLLFSIIAHDLRNPFQALLGLSTILSQAVSARDIASIERRAQGIKEAAAQAYALMESLFAWASLQMDTATIRLVDVDLEEIARETVRGAAKAATEKNISLSTSCSSIQVRGHRDMLAAVLRNLVNNAIKFTPPGGAVTITACPRNDLVEVEVTDTGVGMPPHRISNLFKLDQRTSTTGTVGEQGSGFGLLLCRDLVEQLGTELTVSSTVNHGTKFRFMLAGVLELAG
ncbi:hybrid sensor histidine kinase/response regulator [Sphingomonas sp. RT2P30]|uniref:ATP-binding response regulator n=1 Tax=Parasphingomonas halimpatiens TaxID=3096162 RepID=UPI002FC5ADAD